MTADATDARGSTDSALGIGVILPRILGTHGDGGNAEVLRERLRLRGYAARIVTVGLDEPVPHSLDLYTLGGAEAPAQALAARHLTTYSGLQRAAQRGAPVLAVAASLQLLGRWFTADDGSRVDGLDLLDATTTRPDDPSDRITGEMLAAPLLDDLIETLSGFANHAGRTRLGPDARPLGRLARGPGNLGSADGGGTVGSAGGSAGSPVDGAADSPADSPEDGAVQGSVVATYMHGPVLARNPELADLLLARALGTPPGGLEPLDLESVAQLRRERLAAG